MALVSRLLTSSFWLLIPHFSYGGPSLASRSWPTLLISFWLLTPSLLSYGGPSLTSRSWPTLLSNPFFLRNGVTCIPPESTVARTAPVSAVCRMPAANSPVGRSRWLQIDSMATADHQPMGLGPGGEPARIALPASVMGCRATHRSATAPRPEHRSGQSLPDRRSGGCGVPDTRRPARCYWHSRFRRHPCAAGESPRSYIPARRGVGPPRRSGGWGLWPGESPPPAHRGSRCDRRTSPVRRRRLLRRTGPEAPVAR